MHNKYIFHIIIANLFWSFVPVLVSGLFNSTSIIMVVFLRFFLSGVILFLLSIILIFYNNKFTDKNKISIRQVLKHILEKNEGFSNLRYIIYFLLLGFFGIILHIFGYFFALKITSISFALIGFQLSIIIIAFYEHGIRLERLDIFKTLYLLILIFSISIIIYIKLQDPVKSSISSSFTGWFYIILFAVCVSFLHIGVRKDIYTPLEVKLINKNVNFKMIRMLIKISLIFLLGIATLFPFIILMYLFPIENNLNNEIIIFFEEFSNIFNILFSWDMITLVIFSTIIPYVLMFIASVYWSPYNLTYSQWISILTVIEPTCALLIGVIFTGEYFPVEFLIIVIFLLTISILFRYAHETRNKVNAYILLNIRQGLLNILPIKLIKLNGVCCVQSLIGTYDLLLNIKTNSIKDIYNLINKDIRKIDGIKKIDILFIDKIKKI